MKTYNFLLSCALCITMPLSAQNAEPVMAGHQHVSQSAYRPGEVIVKFKDNTRVNVRRRANGRFSTSNVSAVDAVLNKYKLQTVDALMPLTGNHVSRKKVRSYTGRLVTDTDLSQLYCFKSEDQKISVGDLVDQLKDLDEVEYAEPNYLVYTTDATDTFNDPMLSQQGNLDAINVKPLWAAKPLSSKRPVIAILDTGVDITHPDLVDNIWVNPAEANGADDVDDDGNGFKDDLHGWDFVSQTGRVGDWNGHGTHCAGIAAAAGNNGIGIVGANPDALIMNVTVMQSDGAGDIATIIKGIDYASANGADVISMSIGGYSYSMAEEQALSKAYSTSVLVAAAGNNCKTLGPENCWYCGSCPAPMYPAAFTFVLGVQASDALGFGGFSNNDLQDGPILSSYDEEKLYNYELQAPGVGILSTYPNGRYKCMSGTSMACPLVAGTISRLLQTKEYLSKEILYGDLIHTSFGNINAESAYNLSDADRKPNFHLVTFEIDDSEGDGDGRPDAGELIKIYPTIRNDWGQADNIRLRIDMAENEDPYNVEFIEQEVDFGHSLSSYAKSKSDNPLVIRLHKDIADGRRIRLAVTGICDNVSEDNEPQEFKFTVENGVELGGTQRENITLEPGISYIVTRNWGIPRDVTVTVKAGTTIKLRDDVGISNYGHMIFEGTRDSMITITKGDNDLGNTRGFLLENANYISFNYVIFENLGWYWHFDGHEYNNCIMRDCWSYNYLTANSKFRNCDIYNNHVYETPSWQVAYLSLGSEFTECNIHNNIYESPNGYAGLGSIGKFYRSNYIDNEVICYPNYDCISSFAPKELDESNCFGNRYNVFPNENFSFVYNSTEPEIAYLGEAYLGTGSKEIALKTILDTEDNVGWGTVDVWKMRDMAVKEAPGCVSYVEVDGYDPLDQADMLPPLGVGEHTIKVYFNRQMNTEVIPSVFMGVRPPYTQKNIGKDGKWESKSVFTSKFTIDGKSATDGLNRIRIYGYQQKENDFVLPIERLRYNVQVQAAGSMSTGAVAEPGLGKVTLKWETKEDEFADLMGFNLCRFTVDDAGVSSDTIVVNSSLIEPGEIDEDKVMTQEYVDYEVVPGTSYYYFVRELSTDFTQNEISNVVVAKPLTSIKGDSNGSMTVDVADVMTDINYIMGEKPQPFIFEAADVNADNEVNIIDVMSTVDMIMNPGGVSQSSIEAIASYYVKDGKLYIDSPVDLGGIQVVVNRTDGTQTTYPALEALNGMEQLSCWQNAEDWLFLSFSMSDKSLEAGTQPVLDIDAGTVKSVVLSDTHGRNVLAVSQDATAIHAVEELPSSFDGSVSTRIFDISGREVTSATMLSGVYIVHLYKDGKKVKTYKLLNK